MKSKNHAQLIKSPISSLFFYTLLTFSPFSLSVMLLYITLKLFYILLSNLMFYVLYINLNFLFEFSLKIT